MDLPSSDGRKYVSVSPVWRYKRAADGAVPSVDLPPSQVVRVAFGVKRWEDSAEGIEETRKYARRKIGAVLHEEIDPSEPPPLEVSCTHFSGVWLFSGQRSAIAHRNASQSDLALTFDSEE